MASWLPVYPVDVIKTGVQLSEKGSYDVALSLYEQGGVMAFFDGLSAKMMRAAVNHATTFLVYSKLLLFFS